MPRSDCGGDRDGDVGAVVGQAGEGVLLAGVDGQTPAEFHREPFGDVAATGVGGQPGGRVLVALGLVDVVGDRDQGAVVPQVVGEGAALGGGPVPGAGVPRLGQRDE